MAPPLALPRDRAPSPRSGLGRRERDPRNGGYGVSSRIHTTRILSLSEDLALVVIIVDAEEKIRAFLPQLDELIGEAW